MGHGMMRSVLGVCWIAVGVAAHQSAAQAVRTETVLPASTDPAISGWFGAHFAAFAPTAATRDRLFVYLHGQGGTAGGATELVKSAAEVGFHAVGLTYPNDWSPFNVCGGDPACPEALRREIVDGVDRTPVISVARADSIENRLIKLLTRLDALHPGEGWLQFINGGTIRWDLITLWGHSQGGGNAGAGGGGGLGPGQPRRVVGFPSHAFGQLLWLLPYTRCAQCQGGLLVCAGHVRIRLRARCRSNARAVFEHAFTLDQCRTGRCRAVPQQCCR